MLCYQPVSRPMLPAFLLAVDHSHRQLLLVVRGTTQLADALTDLVAHTSALGPGGWCPLLSRTGLAAVLQTDMQPHKCATTHEHALHKHAQSLCRSG